MIYKDLIIIGGGAAGMMCAITAKEKNPKLNIAILEKQNRIGRKLLSTGNGRCNLYNIKGDDEKYYHGSFRRYVNTTFKRCSVMKLSETFSRLGLVTYSDNEGRVYPFSNHAGTVLDVLLYRIEELNIDVCCECNVQAVDARDNSFYITADGLSYKCGRLVVSTGSAAAPKLGSDDSGISSLKNLGHKIIDLSPSLCPLEVKDKKLTHSIKGVRQKGRATLFDGDEYISSEYGEIQFAESALSGICIFNLSTYVKDLRNPIISLNLNPFSDDYAQLLRILKIDAERYKNRKILTFLDGMFVNKLGTAIMKSAGVTEFNKPVSALTKNDIENICDTITDWKAAVNKPVDFNKAQVCSGGVYGEEIYPKTMESKIVNNLYVCGEAIDINGDCGGFNLCFAFASGRIAGESL